MSKLIMFNDEPYALTASVIAGIKTKTRRTVPQSHLDAYDNYKASFKNPMSLEDFLIKRGYARYTKGEIVAIAQRYKDIGLSPSYVHAKKDHSKKNVSTHPIGELPGWNNKMFVAADFMPHHIRITDVKVEKLQSISDEDIRAEGVIELVGGSLYTTNPKNKYVSLIKARNLRGAFIRLIDDVSKKPVFRKNPYVYVFSFELID